MPAASAPEGLPAPTGRHWVGRVSFEWVDPSRTEVYSSNPQDRRELVVWVWYPATPRPGAERAAYLPEAWAPTGQLLGLDAAGLRSHAVADAAVADEQSSYPVLVQSQSGFPPPAVGGHRRGTGQPRLCRGGGEPHLRERGDGVRRRPGRPVEPGGGGRAAGPPDRDPTLPGAVRPAGRGLRLQGRRPGLGGRPARAAARRRGRAAGRPARPGPPGRIWAFLWRQRRPAVVSR